MTMANNLNFWNGVSLSTWVPNYVLLLDPKLWGYNKVRELPHNIKIIMGPTPTLGFHLAYQVPQKFNEI